MHTYGWRVGRASSLLLLTLVLFLLAGRPLDAQWRAIGPFGGAVAVVQVDAEHPGTVMAATRNALLFRSRDNGDSWQPLPFAPQLHAVLHSFLIGNHGRYFAGLGSDSAAYSGLFQSSDEGRTWSRLPGLGDREIWSLAVWPGDTAVMAAGSRDGVYLTTDDGATWKRISPAANRELQPVVSLAFDPTNQKILFAGTPHLPWKTADGGATWHSVHSGMLDDSDVFSIQVDPATPQHVFATACSGIYFSGSGGNLWSKLAGSSSASYRTYVVAQDPKSADTVFAGTAGGLIRSTDRGRTWKKLSDDAARFVAFDPARPGRLFVATDQHGILRSDNGGDTLTGASEGLCNRYFSSLAVSGDNLFAASIYEASSGGVFRVGADAQWQRTAAASALLGEQILSMTAPSGESGTLYATAYRAVLASMDGGKVWTRVPGPPGTARYTGTEEFRGKLVLATEAGVFLSENHGRTWARSTLPAGAGAIRSLTTLQPEMLGIVTAAGLVTSPDGLVWTAAAPLPNHAAMYHAVSPMPGVFLAATSAGLMRTDSAGASWEPVRWAPGASTVSAICLDAEARNHIFTAVYGTIYESPDSGATWSPVAAEASGMISVRALAVVRGQPERLYALTQHQGIFLLPLPASPAGSNAVTNTVSNSGENHKQHERRQDNK